MAEMGCENVDNSFIFYKDYNNGVFDFKIYVCDVITQINGEKKIIRQFNAYFVEPKMLDFYQLSLGAGWFDIPTEILKVGEVDLKNDNVTKNLVQGIKNFRQKYPEIFKMKHVLDNLKYKN